MKISKKLISLPPYVSTSWKNVQSLHYESNFLLISLTDGTHVSIPDLGQETIEQIFDAHATYLEEGNEELPAKIEGSEKDKLKELPFQLTEGTSLNEMGSIMQHNPDQADAPDLPEEMLDKIAAVAEILTPEDPEMIPEPVEDCNCFHCQITRAVRRGSLHEEEEGASAQDEEEDEVTLEDLRFREWDIEQEAEGIYRVLNPLDRTEHYLVHLKDPIGCTCGKERCEHIEAVLKS